jgi:hypothetical protein
MPQKSAAGIPIDPIVRRSKKNFQDFSVMGFFKDTLTPVAF